MRMRWAWAGKTKINSANTEDKHFMVIKFIGTYEEFDIPIYIIKAILPIP
jgi:hypothetical protein